MWEQKNRKQRKKNENQIFGFGVKFVGVFVCAATIPFGGAKPIEIHPHFKISSRWVKNYVKNKKTQTQK